MNDKNTPGDVVAMLDQLSGVVRSVAVVEAAYYQELIQGGIPHHLAEEMVTTWHTMYWDKQLYPDGHPDLE